MTLFALQEMRCVTPAVFARRVDRVCTGCGQVKPLTEFTYKNRQLGLRQRRCRGCTQVYFRAYYARHHDAYVQRIRAKNAAERRANRSQVLEYLRTHPCVDCGETDPVVLQFDHEDPLQKSWNVGELLRRRVPWSRVLREIEKCSVRCANDHQRRTARQFGWFKLQSVITRP